MALSEKFQRDMQDAIEKSGIHSDHVAAVYLKEIQNDLNNLYVSISTSCFSDTDSLDNEKNNPLCIHISPLHCDDVSHIVDFEMLVKEIVDEHDEEQNDWMVSRLEKLIEFIKSK